MLRLFVPLFTAVNDVHTRAMTARNLFSSACNSSHTHSLGFWRGLCYLLWLRVAGFLGMIGYQSLLAQKIPPHSYPPTLGHTAVEATVWCRLHELPWGPWLGNMCLSIRKRMEKIKYHIPDHHKCLHLIAAIESSLSCLHGEICATM